MGRNGDIDEAIADIKAKVCVFSKKLEMHERRKEFRRQNQYFELFRRRFYRKISEAEVVTHQVTKDEIKEFWSTMWNRKENTEEDYDKYLCEFLPGTESPNVFPSYEEFQQIVKFLPSWKAAGVDGIYNFFIKKCEPVHKHLYEIIRGICIGEVEEEGWFYKGITYLIPKGSPAKGSDFRPITCVSNLYKLATKCLTKVIQELVEERGLLAENQLGTMRMVQGAKEQALLNIAINKEHRNMLKTTWVDVKKAFDSVDHSYLIRCIESLNLPIWITKFLKRLINKWEVAIQSGGYHILTKKVERGILQGDSLSPLLLCYVWILSAEC